MGAAVISPLIRIYRNPLIRTLFQDEFRRQSLHTSSALRGLAAADAEGEHSHRGDDEDIVFVRFAPGAENVGLATKGVHFEDELFPRESMGFRNDLISSKGIGRIAKANFIKQIKLRGRPSRTPRKLRHYFSPPRELFLREILSSLMDSKSFLTLVTS